MDNFIERIKDKFFRTEPDPVFASIIDNTVKLVKDGVYTISRYSDGDMFLYSGNGKIEILLHSHPRPNFYVRVVTYNEEGWDDRSKSTFFATAGNKAVVQQLHDIIDEQEREKLLAAPGLVLGSLNALVKGGKNEENRD